MVCLNLFLVQHSELLVFEPELELEPELVLLQLVVFEQLHLKHHLYFHITPKHHLGKTSKILQQIRDDANIEQYNVHGNDLQAEVHNAFQNLFSRNAFNIELEKYVKVLQKSKNLPINSIVKKVSKFDKDVYENKQEIAKFVFVKGGAVKEFDLSKVTKANPIDVKSLASLDDLEAEIGKLPDNDFVPTVFDGLSYNLTDGQDNLPGTNKNDIFTGSSSDKEKLNTANGVDILDGKKGIDTLKISADGKVDIGIPNITNIEIIEVTSTDKVTVNTTSTTGVTDLKVVKASGTTATKVVDATAGSETNITVSGVTSGNIETVGGKDVTVTDTASTSANVSTITVGGATTTPTGNVKITANLNSDGTATLAGKAIGVTGGKTVDVTVNSTITAKDKDATSNIVNGAITVTGDGKTTDVTVKQNSKVTPVKTPAVDAVEGTTTVTFKDLAKGKTVTIESLVFTASKDLTAAQVAQAFANLTKLDTQSSTGITENGFYTNALTGNLVSSAANGATVVFTDGTAIAPTFTPGTTGTALDAPVTVNGTAPILADDTANKVTYGAVKIEDHATTKSIKTITVDGYGATSTIGAAATGSVDALTDLTLKNSDSTMGVTTDVASLNLTVDNINDNVTLTATKLTTLNLTATGEDSKFVLAAAAVETLTIAAAANLDITDSFSTSTTLKTVTITGTGDVDLGDISVATVTALTASAAKGAISATVDASKATVTTGAGDDSITVKVAANVTKAIDLGAGNDRLDLSTITTVNAATTATIAGGAGTDTVVLAAANAAFANLSSDTNSAIFKSKVTGFEKLEIGDAGTTTTVNVGNLGYNYVITNANATLLTLAGMANNGTVELNGASLGGTEVLVKDAVATAADKLNVVIGDGGDLVAIDFGTLTVADVGTIAITTTNTFVDIKDKDGNNIADGIDDTGSLAQLSLIADAAKTVYINGAGDLDLDTVAVTPHANLKTVDASKLEGDLTFTIDSLAANFVLTSGSGADKITVSTSNNAQVKTGLGADTITIEYGAVSANIWGGAGNDIFKVEHAISSSTQYVTIEDATSGDQIILGTSNFLSGDITITDFDEMTLTDKFKAVLEDTTLNVDRGADDTFAISFQHAKNTYIVVSDGDGTVNFEPNNDHTTNPLDTCDQVIKLTGLKDLSAGASFNIDGTLEIA